MFGMTLPNILALTAIFGTILLLIQTIVQIISAVTTFLQGKQSNQHFAEQNRLTKIQMGLSSITASGKKARYLLLGWLVVAFMWAAVINNSSDRKFAIYYLAALLIVGMGFLLVLRNLLSRQNGLSPPTTQAVRAETDFDRLIKTYGKWSFEAAWGTGLDWFDTTLRGFPLRDKVILLLCAGDDGSPQKVEHQVLEMSDDPPIYGRAKELRLIYPDGRYIKFPENTSTAESLLRLDPGVRLFGRDSLFKISRRASQQVSAAAVLGKAIDRRLPEIRSPFAGNPTEWIGRMGQNYKSFENGIYELDDERKNRIQTPDPFTVPIAFRVVAMTNSTNVRLSYVEEEIIFNWEQHMNEGYLHIWKGPFARRFKDEAYDKRDAGRITKNELHTFDLVYRNSSFSISVDGFLKLTEQADFSGSRSPFSVFAGALATVHVVSVQSGEPRSDA